MSKFYSYVYKEDIKLLCDRIEQKVRGINTLFSTLPENIEKEAEFIYRRILNEKLLDCTTVSVASSFPAIEDRTEKSRHPESGYTFHIQ